MCRFTLYLGPSIRLSSLLIDPSHSLIRQSAHSREREEPLNGDGFGVGWYATHFKAEPAVFRSITPAWNNRNLQNLTRVVASECIMAHVRAASQYSGVNEANCHPFRFRQYLFMHNGDIGNFQKVRRRLLDSVCDEAFGNVYGSTDSEHFFAVFIDELLQLDEKMEQGERLATALCRAIRRVVDIVNRHGGGAPSFINIAIADGDHAVVARFTDDPAYPPESLYYFKGDLYPHADEERSLAPGGPVIVSSERLTGGEGWEPIQPNYIVVLRRSQEPELRTCGI